QAAGLRGRAVQDVARQRTARMDAPTTALQAVGRDRAGYCTVGRARRRVCHREHVTDRPASLLARAAARYAHEYVLGSVQWHVLSVSEHRRLAGGDQGPPCRLFRAGDRPGDAVHQRHHRELAAIIVAVVDIGPRPAGRPTGWSDLRADGGARFGPARTDRRWKGDIARPYGEPACPEPRAGRARIPDLPE